MSYGRLAALKMIGEKPTFVILDKDENILTTIPDLNDWMFGKIGKLVSLFFSDDCFQLVDQKETNKK